MILILILQPPKTLTLLDNPQVMTTTPTKTPEKQEKQQEAKTKATAPPMVRDP